MLRATLCAAALFAAGSFAQADELDKEAPAPKAPPAMSVAPNAPGTELDQESPDAAYHYRGGWGHRGGHYGGSWGYGGYRGGYGYRGYGYSGFHGGWGYRPYYSGYYRPYYARPYYGTSIRIGYPGFGFSYGYSPWY